MKVVTGQVPLDDVGLPLRTPKVMLTSGRPRWRVVVGEEGVGGAVGIEVDGDHVLDTTSEDSPVPVNAPSPLVSTPRTRS